ncbi:selenide, water dikinase SelD [Helicobacter sp. 16-1353]|uniref:selenide, water dikinase SelD n=1 Tax=Helicobacter sp. 16-1353 TaxID=2004996 RepID=UPI000DCCBBBA|nr:selenide, water dikinase SelD [Helicobacter sp. 16-1353]RAX53141.1 selenide, water dikinase SelD [Helicobacter sp. 16-1353]
MGLADLRQITANLNQPNYPNLLVDFKDNDDSGIYQVGDMLLVQSVDFITPVVDSLYIYGQIAAANSLSDVFAKGAEAKTALSILMWDDVHITTSEVNEILQGGLSKLIEADCALLGGHSINDKEQKFGLSVTGVIDLKAKDAPKGGYWRNNTAKIGDSIILTKPLGSGILTTAMKAGLMEFKPNLDVVISMASLNLKAMQVAKAFEIHACSDVTGFGLIGHLNEMINENISIKIYTNNILLFDRVEEFSMKGAVPGGSWKNKMALESVVKNNMGAKIGESTESSKSGSLDSAKSGKSAESNALDSLAESSKSAQSSKIKNQKNDIIYYDTQTSGGLLIALESRVAEKLNRILNEEGVESHIIAECVAKSDYRIYLI